MLLLNFAYIPLAGIIALQRLPGIGTKGLPAALYIGSPHDGIGLEVEQPWRQDAEKTPH